MNEKKHIITNAQSFEEIQNVESELKKVNIKIGLSYFAPIASFLSSFAVASIYLNRPEEILVAGSIFGTLLGIEVFSKFNPDYIQELKELVIQDKENNLKDIDVALAFLEELNI